jgi:hypothetical protein
MIASMYFTLEKQRGQRAESHAVRRSLEPSRKQRRTKQISEIQSPAQEPPRQNAFAAQAAVRLAGQGADLIPYWVPEIGERDLSTGVHGRSAGAPDSFPAAKPNKRLTENYVGTKRTGKGRRKVGRKKRRMRAKIRHRKG